MFEDEKNGQNNSYGSNNYGSGYGQQNNSSNGYVNNNYMNNQNPYGTQNTYGNQNTYSYGNGQQTYGTYQFSSNNFGNNQEPPRPPKKKHTAGIVIAAILILSLVVGGVGAGYYAYSRRELFTASNSGAIEDKSSADDNVVAEAEAKDAEEQTEATEKKVETTTTSAAASVVVTDVTQVVSEVMPAMVIIHNNYTASANYFGYTQTQEATASGSGIIVGENDTELLIATNYHVIEGADSLEVIFNDETAVEAVVKGTDSDMDLAVIAVLKEEMSSETFDSIKVATLGDSDSLTLGEPAIAIGNALGYGQSVTTGVISAVNREVEISEGVTHTFIQTDAAINPGNSGGALLNIQGEVIGINSNKIGGDTVEGMGYAIPISVAQPIIDKLMNEETKRKVSDEERGYIGISGVSVTSSVSQMYGLPMGVYVAEVGENGGAAAAGIQKGDVIVAFDGEEITSMDDLQNRLEYYAKGTTVSVTVMRQNGSEYVEVTMDVTLGEITKSSSADSNAGESGNGSGRGQYSGQQQPGLPDDKNGQGSGNSQQEGSGH
jgi:serine protease Do